MDSPFPDWIQALPEIDAPFPGLRGRLLASEHGQAAFFTAETEMRVPEHAHGAQWGFVVAGRVQMTIGGTTRTYGPGETYAIRDAEPHSALLEAGTSVVDVFADATRYRARPRP